jgi:hypothetical protein
MPFSPRSAFIINTLQKYAGQSQANVHVADRLCCKSNRHARTPVAALGWLVTRRGKGFLHFALGLGSSLVSRLLWPAGSQLALMESADGVLLSISSSLFERSVRFAPSRSGLQPDCISGFANALPSQKNMEMMRRTRRVAGRRFLQLSVLSYSDFSRHGGAIHVASRDLFPCSADLYLLGMTCNRCTG